MISKADVDFGRTADDYARYRAGFPASFFDRLVQGDYLAAGKDVLDLGTGTGTIARGLAGRGFAVTGLDRSRPLLQAAEQLDRAADVHVTYRLGTAEASGLPSRSFDVAIAGQCWHWFDQQRVLAEVARLLRPGGALVIAYFDWLPEAGPVQAMLQLQAKYHPAWRDDGWPLGFYPQDPGELRLAGWRACRSFRYVEDVAYSHQAWRGRMRAYAGIGGSLPAAVVEAFDAEFAAVLATRFPQQPMLIPHGIWAGLWRPETQPALDA